jgi:hypothetical protein
MRHNRLEHEEHYVATAAGIFGDCGLNAPQMGLVCSAVVQSNTLFNIVNDMMMRKGLLTSHAITCATATEFFSRKLPAR